MMIDVARDIAEDNSASTWNLSLANVHGKYKCWDLRELIRSIDIFRQV